QETPSSQHRVRQNPAKSRIMEEPGPVRRRPSRRLAQGFRGLRPGAEVRDAASGGNGEEQAMKTGYSTASLAAGIIKRGMLRLADKYPFHAKVLEKVRLAASPSVGSMG